MKRQYRFVLFVKFLAIWGRHFWSIPLIKSLYLFKSGFQLTSVLGLGFSFTDLGSKHQKLHKLLPEFLQSIPEVIYNNVLGYLIGFLEG